MPPISDLPKELLDILAVKLRWLDPTWGVLTPDTPSPEGYFEWVDVPPGVPAPAFRASTRA